MRLKATLSTLSHQTGSSLVEVLVSVFVLAFGILGIASMQSGALRNNQGALEQSAVVILTHSILDAMRANMADDGSGDLVVDSSYVTHTMTTDGFICKADDVKNATSSQAENDLKRWVGSIQQGLGADDACGKIVCEAANPNNCTVSIRWDNSRSLGGSSQHVVENRSIL